ncbi:MAG: SusE domain-containing protein [Saprospiraceae bacterium]|nr:SusE domain-containing protein [Saprospiraceae bacterium]MCF8248501.1 SusE domain-containing protein [Saprospiraceae bacterium]MCF8280572.1 SusE domain-containing protein [Bacteroidales bacterium]MCF8310235.1 SusE domain-containing protein [Saprospiraceae bacterium]MCF8439326.1 SusE domain-containing protein [Saprospiraceae bacterium]
MIRKYFTFLLATALLLQACSDDKLDPVLTLNKAQVITNPASSTTYTLTAATKDDAFENITWTAADFNLKNVPKTTYVLQMDLAGNGFTAPANLTTTSELNFEISVGELNNKLILKGAAPDVPVDVELRVVSNIDKKLDDIYSDVVTISVTPFGAVINVKPVYLLGDATLAGWDNAGALPFTYLDGGRYEIVTTLTGGLNWKFISTLGQWAPQWGTDGTGTPASGPLSYRPTESDPDPVAIVAPATTSQYKIIVDTALLTYEVVEYGDVYLLGDATIPGWDNTAALPFVKVSDGKYSIITTLAGAGTNWKIIDERGAWAPQWGSDGTGTANAGILAYRPTEADPDPAAIPSPDDAGTYKIEIDIVSLTYTVTLQ